MIRSVLITISFILFSCSAGNNTESNSLPTQAKIPAEAMHSLENEEDLDILLEKVGNDRIVLLGEATHGTSEFYSWRSKISQRLIEEKDFNIIAVEGDWTDAYPLNNYIRGNSTYPNAEVALQHFDRWPQWMWANKEIRDLAEWLLKNNSGKSAEKKTGFYGLDVYGIWESLDAVFAFLQKRDPSAAAIAQSVVDCFAPFRGNENAYARATVNSNVNCAEEVRYLLETVQAIVKEEKPKAEASFNALQNTLVVVNAEDYYRTAAVDYPESWNIRDRHMMGTINRLLDNHGPGSKILVWEHNTHVGDARATDMKNAGMVNVGQLAREEHGPENVYIVGFGTYKGTVIAAKGWGSKSKVMNVKSAEKDSWEWLLHKHGPANKIIFMDLLKNRPFFQQGIGHRAIGVVYNPGKETGNYVPSVIPHRYDAFLFIDETTALNPLSGK